MEGKKKNSPLNHGMIRSAPGSGDRGVNSRSVDRTESNRSQADLIQAPRPGSDSTTRIEGEQNTKENRSFFVGNFGGGSWRASPIMRDFVFRSRSAIDRKKDIMESLSRSTSAPKASDLKSRITPPPFNSLVGGNASVFNPNKGSRDSTPSPAALSSNWNDISPFTAKRRQGQGSAPPWTGLKGEEAWNSKFTSRTPSPASFKAAPPAPLPFFSRSPPKVSSKSERTAPNSDGRPVRSQLAEARRKVHSGISDGKPLKYGFRSLTPNSLVPRHRTGGKHLKSIAQHRGTLPSPISSHLGLEKKGRESRIKTRNAQPFSSSGAFKAIKKNDNNIPRVHQLSQSLQEMGLGGQQDLQEGSNEGLLNPLDSAEGQPSSNVQVLENSSKSSSPGKRDLQQQQNASHTSDSYQKNPDQSYETKTLLGVNTQPKYNGYGHTGPQENQGMMYGQHYDPSQVPYPIMTQHSPQLRPQVPPQYLQPGFPPTQYSYPSPPFGAVHAMTLPMTHLQLQPALPHMVPPKSNYMHPGFQTGYPGTMMAPAMEGNIDPSQIAYHRPHVPQYNSRVGNPVQPRYPPNAIQYSSQKTRKKTYENSRSIGSQSSLQELQGKLSMLLNSDGNNGEVDKLLPLFEGRVSVLAKTQCGSRFLQQRIGEGHPGYFSLVIKEVFEDLPALMVDLFGNYLCQKLIEKCNERQRDLLLVKLANCVPDISCDRQGTRAVQKIVGVTTTANQREVFISALSREADLLRLIRDPNGSHVVHAVLDKFPLSMLSPIFKLAYKTCHKLAVHQHGLCVLKKCITLAKPKDFLDLSKKILEQVLMLVNDQYGNYLVQHIIDRSIINQKNAGEQADMKDSSKGNAIEFLHGKLKPYYCQLSKQKFSSNVVEKCLRVGDAKWQAEIIQELMDTKSSKMDNSVLSLLQDSYGNYVMQNALNVAEPDQASQLVKMIKPHLSALRKNIRKKWERLITAKCSVLSQPNGSFNKKQPTHHVNHEGGKPRSSQKGRYRQHQQKGNGHGWRGSASYQVGYVDYAPQMHQQMHGYMMRSQAGQMMQHTSELHPPQGQMQRVQSGMVHYPQTYIPQIQYAQPQQTSHQMYLDSTMPNHRAPTY